MFLILLPAICLVHFNENTSELPLGANKEATITLISHIMEHSDSRRIAMFLVINMAFMFVEAIYGYWNNSLGLISDAAHM
jgi:zinc transporter 5/7